MQLTIRQLRDVVRNVLSEALGATNMLDVIQMRLILAKEKKVEEILTGVRIIKGCATVSQVMPIQRLPNGSRVMEIKATVDPKDMDIMDYIDAMAHIIKKIPDVTTVVIKSLNDQPVRDATGKRKLVY